MGGPPGGYLGAVAPNALFPKKKKKKKGHQRGRMDHKLYTQRKKTISGSLRSGHSTVFDSPGDTSPSRDIASRIKDCAMSATAPRCLPRSTLSTCQVTR